MTGREPDTLLVPLSGGGLAEIKSWQTNPCDPRTREFGDIPPEVAKEYEVRMLPVKFLVRKELPQKLTEEESHKKYVHDYVMNFGND